MRYESDEVDVDVAHDAKVEEVEVGHARVHVEVVVVDGGSLWNMGQAKCG